MIVGYTGPRLGLLPPQRLALGEVLSSLSGTMHNGAAEGGDRAAAELWGQWPWRRGIEFFPCNREQREWAVLWIQGTRAPEARTVHPIRPPLVRNRENLVDPCDLLVATPAGPKPEGGTWSTIRYARRVEKPVVLVWPDGRMEWERCSLETGWCESCSTWLIDSGGPNTTAGEYGRVWQCTDCWHEEPGAAEPDAQGRFVL